MENPPEVNEASNKNDDNNKSPIGFLGDSSRGGGSKNPPPIPRQIPKFYNKPYSLTPAPNMTTLKVISCDMCGADVLKHIKKCPRCGFCANCL